MQLRTLLRKSLLREASAKTWMARRLSAAHADHILYVLYRSRGFLVRKSSRWARELTEVYGLALIASLEQARAAVLIWLLHVALGGLSEALFFSLRGALVEHRSLSRRQLVGVSVGLQLAFALVAWFVLHRFFQQHPIMGAMFAIRTACGLVEAAMGMVTLEISARIRVYMSPYISFGLLGAALVGTALCTHLSGGLAVLALVAFHSALRLSEQAYFLRRSLRANELDRTLRSEFVAEISVSDRGAPSSLLTQWRRGLFWMLPQVPTFALVYLAYGAGQLPRGLAIFALAVFFQHWAQRPFSAFSVDVIRALGLQQWRLASHQVRTAGRLGLVFIAVAAVVAAVQHFVVGGDFRLVWALGFLFAIVHAFGWSAWLRAGSTNLEARLLPQVAAGHVGGALLAWGAFHLSRSFPISLGILLASEAVVVTWVFRSMGRIQPAAWLEDSFTRTAGALESSLKYSPTHFFMAYRVLQPLLREYGFREHLFLVTLRRARPSERKMGQLLERMGRDFRRGDLFTALDSQRILLWLPNSEAANVALLRERLMLSLPLDMLSVQPIPAEHLRDLLYPATAGGPPDNVALLKRLGSPAEFQSFLESAVQASGLARDDVEWWTLRDGSDWVSNRGARATREQEGAFESITRRAGAQQILTHSRGRRPLDDGFVYKVLRPLGEPLAVFACRDGKQEKAAALFHFCNRALFSSQLERRDSPEMRLTPVRFRIVTYVIGTFAERMGVRVSIAPAPPAAGARLLATCEDGSGEPRVATLEPIAGKKEGANASLPLVG